MAAEATFSEQHAADSSSERIPPSFCSATYADATSVVVGTTSRARWKMACRSNSPRDALSCRLRRASVARWYADNAATMTTTSEVTPATCRDLMDMGWRRSREPVRSWELDRRRVSLKRRFQLQVPTSSFAQLERGRVSL